MIYLLTFEEDGHLHGKPPPKPWVAEITGIDPRFGLARRFVRPLRDFRHARAAMSGNIYGVVTTFPLHEGRFYEIARCRGRGRGRAFGRKFFYCDAGHLHERTEAEALDYAAARSAA